MLSFTENFTIFGWNTRKDWIHVGIGNCSTLEDNLQEIIYNIIYFTNFIQ